MSAELISELESVTGILDRDAHRNPIVGRFRWGKQQIYLIRLCQLPRTAGQKQNSNRFRQAVLATKGIYDNPTLFAQWLAAFKTYNGSFRGRHYKTLYGFIMVNMLNNIN